MATPDLYREMIRRQNRLLGTYLALWAWKQGVDCVVIPRTQLLPYLGLDRMRDDRIDWLKQDLKDMFRHTWSTIDSKSNIYATLYLSRKRIPQAVTMGSMTDEDRVARLKASGVRASIVSIPNERKIIRTLSLLLYGVGKLRAASAL